MLKIGKVACLSLVSALSLVGCANKNEVAINQTAPDAEHSRPTMIDQEIVSLSRQLIDETRKLANQRQLKLDSTFQEQKKVSSTKYKTFSGLEVKRDFDCDCDIKTALQSLAINLNWDMDSVYEIGRKPAQGVPVEIHFKNMPMSTMLEMLDVQVGSFVDIRLDPNFETILISYKTISQPHVVLENAASSIETPAKISVSVPQPQTYMSPMQSDSGGALNPARSEPLEAAQ
ncbi:DotD/TraH family lipoprotein [Vibrio sp. Hal054]|uniref:DotD/TraH family lipoprotein n=1 Tax=Vibrio sp. Hal054 TaxID=3035158 RepID=UPI00301D6DCE